MSFKFELNDNVLMKYGKEEGVVCGRAEYLTCESAYLLKYANNQGVAVEWWAESDIEKAVK